MSLVSDPSRLRAMADRHHGELVALRRDIHANPELSWAEHRTTRLVVERLAAAGIDARIPARGTGAVADVVLGDGDGPTVALRADLDALRLDDGKEVAYRSRVSGVCHACGHDVHTVTVLGAGLVLGGLDGTDVPAGRVRLIFQPAEETIPGGAVRLIEEGALDDVEAIFALHCDPTLPAGAIGLRPGAVTSAADMVRVRLGGAGGHTARPHLTTDLVHLCGQIVTEVPAGLSRLTDPDAGASLVFGSVHAGHAPNVIPEEAVIEGTFRARWRSVWDEAPALIRRLVEAQAESAGATWELDHERGNPPVENDPEVTALVEQAAAEVLGPEQVRPTVQSSGGEDFSWYLERVPGCYVRLGVGRPGEGPAGDLHRPDFDVDESAIPVGVSMLVASALAALRR